MDVQRDRRVLPEMADHAKVCGLRLESIEELFSVAHVQADVDARVRLLEGTQDIGQDVDPDRRVAEDAEHAPTQTLELIDGAAGSAALGEDPTGMLVQQDSGIRQPGPVDRRAGVANIKFHKEARVNPDKLMRMVGRIKGAQFTPAGVLRVPLDGLTSPIEVLEYLRERAVELMA